MSLVNVGLLGQNTTVTQSGTNSVAFVAPGTLNIAGTPTQPVAVNLSQVSGIGSGNTIALTNANVTLNGVAGVNALTNYAIGSGSTLTIANTVGVSPGSSVTFTGGNGALVMGSGTSLGVLNSVAGLAPGNVIDVSGLATQINFLDNAGAGTGGKLQLLNSVGQVLATVPLTTGDFTAGQFQLTPDGVGGTKVTLGVGTSGVTTSPATAAVGAGMAVMLKVGVSAPVTVTPSATGGLPTLVLNNGGAATFNPAASSGTMLAFNYTVKPGENTPDLAVVGVPLNGATVLGVGGIPVDLSGAAINPAGTLQVDTTAPVVTGVGVTAGALQPGELVGIGLATSKGVTVSGGTPTLSLSDGGIATFDPLLSTATMLVFTHMVPTGLGIGLGAGAGLTVTGVSLNGSSITDPAGNPADVSGVTTMTPTQSGAFATGGGGTGATGSGGTTPGGTGAGQGKGVYRFFDSGTGTHFFTADVNEKNTLMNSGSAGFRPDLKEEVNNFGAVSASAGDANAETVFRFFDTVHGTHFFTASQAEANNLKTVGSSTYRADLVYEASSSFLEHSTQQVGDVAVYRFFDQKFGTHFYTGSQSEFAAITTPGTAAYRTDLVSEGVGFYAPAGSYS